MFWLFPAIFLTVICVLLLNHRYKHWRRLGVPQSDVFSIYAGTWKMFLRQKPVSEVIQDIYNLEPDSRYSGFYQFTDPVLVLKDPDLIKQITVKDFDHFFDRRGFLSEEIEPLFGKNLFSLVGEKWRDMRSTLSPAFTSSKMKYMFCLMKQSGQQFADYFLKQNEDTISLEMKDTFTRFTNDVIANIAFGVECDSLKERNNEFYLIGREASEFADFKKLIKFFLFFFSPRIFKWLRIRLWPEEMATFYLRLVKENIAYRESQGAHRPDLINLLMEARKHGLKHEELPSLPDAGFATVQESEVGKKVKTERMKITDEDIVAQAFAFYVGGFETVSTSMCFLAHELAINPDIQERLRQEVDDTLDSCQNNLTYEALTGMKYMDMVVSEGLRKWPTATAIDRFVTKAYTIQPKKPNEKPIYLKEKSMVLVPIYAFHRDPKYFPEPERFDPERFNDENKKLIRPFSFMPFGVGPRNCIGSRFGLLDVKILFFYLLANFEIIPTEKTQIPLKMDSKTLFMGAEKGFWLAFRRRVK